MDAYEDKMMNVQKMFSELKTLIEGFNYRIERESRSWKDHMEGLEKEIETSKNETCQRFANTRLNIQNDIKVKLAEILSMIESDKEDQHQLVFEMFFTIITFIICVYISIGDNVFS